MLSLHLPQNLEPRIVVMLQDLSRGDLMPIELTQMVIDSAIKIEVDPRLFLEGAILRIPSYTFKLDLELLIPNTMADKRNSLSLSKLEQRWLARESPYVVLLILNCISECLRIYILDRQALSGRSASTRSRRLWLPIIALCSIWCTSILATLGRLSSIIIVVTAVAHLKVHHKLFSMI